MAKGHYLGTPALAINVSSKHKYIIFDYSNKLVDIYKDAKYKDYNGSIYIQDPCYQVVYCLF